MSLLRIVLKNLRQRALSSALTSLSIGLGVAVVVAILSLQSQSKSAFEQSAVGHDLVVGPRGSSLQLVLVTVFHLDQLQSTIPYSVYKEIARDKRVRAAAPLAVGDTYKGHRLVATIPRLLSDFEVLPGRKFELAGGRLFESSEALVDHLMEGEGGHDHAHEGIRFEAVVGAIAARKTGLGVGSTFVATHGLEEGKTHEEQWTVTGVLKPTGTPADRAIYINLESFSAIGDHTKAAAAEKDRQGRISAVLVVTKGARARDDLRYDYQNRTDAMAVRPVEEIVTLFELLGNIDKMLLAVSLLVILVAGVSILVSIYNSMSERKRPIAILRALGARRTTILTIILMEATTLCLIGGIAGVIAGHALTGAAGR
ncbi:MAG TPA: ABC transporter permease, partial [Candidatus Eisenbacteria bacterium]|nr:ABC transporter permease [Candidatus Eisenbacteria bacterium]